MMNVRENKGTIKNGQTRDSGNIEHTRQTNTTQHRKLKR